jgi:hypothetical protein
LFALGTRERPDKMQNAISIRYKKWNEKAFAVVSKIINVGATLI